LGLGLVGNLDRNRQRRKIERKNIRMSRSPPADLSVAQITIQRRGPTLPNLCRNRGEIIPRYPRHNSQLMIEGEKNKPERGGEPEAYDTLSSKKPPSEACLRDGKQRFAEKKHSLQGGLGREPYNKKNVPPITLTRPNQRLKTIAVRAVTQKVVRTQNFSMRGPDQRHPETSIRKLSFLRRFGPGSIYLSRKAFGSPKMWHRFNEEGSRFAKRLARGRGPRNAIDASQGSRAAFQAAVRLSHGLYLRLQGSPWPSSNRRRVRTQPRTKTNSGVYGPAPGRHGSQWPSRDFFRLK